MLDKLKTRLSAAPVINPSILSADFSRLGEDCRAVVEAGASILHVDVMDGHFVPNITLGPDIVKAVARSVDVPLDCHLMVSEPDRYIQPFVDAGASIVTVHAEATHHLHRLLQQIKEAGALAGVSLNPATPLSVIETVLDEIDLVLIMTVNPGFGGQKPIASSIAKVGQLTEMINRRRMTNPPLIEVDGGVKVENIHDYSGSDLLVSGSGVFKLPGWSGPPKSDLDYDGLVKAYSQVLGRFNSAMGGM